MIKNKSIKRYYLIFFILIIFLSEPILASNAKIEFVNEPTYHLYKKTKAGYYYLINVTIKNNGDEESTPIDIKIVEDGLDSVSPDDCQNVILKPNEEKLFSIEWSTVYQNDQIDIKYTASDPSNVTTFNTGATTLIIGNIEKKSDKGLPGFSLLSIIFSLCILLYLYKKKRR